MTKTPIKHIPAPIKSYKSGVFLSMPHPHNTDSATNTPPYAAYTRPNEGNACHVAIIPYKIKAIPPKNLCIMVFLLLAIAKLNTLHQFQQDLLVEK